MEVAAKQAGFSAARLERITEHFQRKYIDEGKLVGCQIAVARHGQLAYARSLGLMDREREKPLADDTIFRIYSMTKPITAVALMMLYDQGHFQLNDPVHRVIPEWNAARVYVSGEGAEIETVPAKSPITFRHILSHTGGLSYGGTPHPIDKLYRKEHINQQDCTSLREFVQRLARVPLFVHPGERWRYSVSSDVCGYLVEALSGKPFDRYLQDEVFEPLGMNDTAFMLSDDKVPRFAANYRREPDKSLKLIDEPETSTYRKPPRCPAGGHGLISTVADYMRFCDMLRRGGERGGQRLLGRRTLELMTRNHLIGGGTLTQLALGAFSETANEGVGFGLGFATTVDGVAAGVPGEGDYYWGGAASTLFWVDPKEDMVAVFMTQLMPSSTFNLRGQLKTLVYSALLD